MEDDVSSDSDTEIFSPDHHQESILITKNLLLRCKSVRIGERANYINSRHVVAMVGLPARGKTYISRKLTRYLNWVGIKTKVFNLGDYRRSLNKVYEDHNFFRADNAEAMAVRAQCAIDALRDVYEYLENQDGVVAIFDATNSTMNRRRVIYDYVVIKMDWKLFFIESICDDPKVIEKNILEVKCDNPDYKGKSKDAILEDFMERIQHYRDAYETLDEKEEDYFSFIKMYNTGQRCTINKHQGNIQCRIIYYLMNIHIKFRTIYLSRAGESMNNVNGRLGGNSSLTKAGEKYAKSLSNFINKQKIHNLHVWTSWLNRSLETASHINYPQEQWILLDELKYGDCEDLTYEEIEEKFPNELQLREENPFSHRFPKGESYEDVVGRLEPVIMELERQENILLISHQAILRCLLAYYLDNTSEELPNISVPFHTLFKLTPVAYGCRMEKIKLVESKTDINHSKQDILGHVQDQLKN